MKKFGDVFAFEHRGTDAYDNDIWYLNVTDDEHAGERFTRGKPFSASTFNSLKPRNCTANWLSQKWIKFDDDPFAANTVGTAGHQMLEDLMGFEPGRRSRDQAVWSLLKQADQMWGPDLTPNNYRDKTLWINAVMDAVDKYWEIEDPDQVEVVASEMPFGTDRESPLEIDGIPTVGFIDSVRADGDGVRVIDYKTSAKRTSDENKKKYGDDHGDQIRLYKMALQASGYERVVVSGAVFYVRLGEVSEVDVGNRAVGVTRRSWKKSWERYQKSIENRSWEVKPGGLCPWCPLSSVCPAANTERVATVSVERGLLPLEPDFIGMPGNGVSQRFAELTGQESSTIAHTDQKEATTMTYQLTDYDRNEGKPYEIVNGDNSFNRGSYAFIGPVGLTTLAYELLRKNGQKITGANVKKLSLILAQLVTTVDVAFTGENRASWHSSLNTRIRGAVRTVTEFSAPPFGKDNDAWTAWRDEVIKHSKSLIMVGNIVIEYTPNDSDPFELDDEFTEPSVWTETATKPTAAKRAPARKRAASKTKKADEAETEKKAEAQPETETKKADPEPEVETKVEQKKPEPKTEKKADPEPEQKKDDDPFGDFDDNNFTTDDNDSDDTSASAGDYNWGSDGDFEWDVNE